MPAFLTASSTNGGQTEVLLRLYQRRSVLPCELESHPRLSCVYGVSNARRASVLSAMCRLSPFLLLGTNKSFRTKLTEVQSMRAYCSLRRIPVFKAITNYPSVPGKRNNKVVLPSATSV